MFRIFELILLIILTCAIDKASLKQKRILNGTIVKEKQFPFLVALTNRKHRTACSGSLIAVLKVISAAHCFKKGHNKVLVEAGNVNVQSKIENPNKQRRNISNIMLHPDYENFLKKHGTWCWSADIAIITVEYPFNITDYVSLIKIAESNLTINSLIIIAGFGQYKHNQTGQDGKARYGNFGINTIKIYKGEIYPVYISNPITQYKATLPGDSGGPVVNRHRPYVLHGVHSGGDRKTSGIEVIVSIERNRDFILKHLNPKSLTFRRSGQKTIGKYGYIFTLNMYLMYIIFTS